MLSVTLDWSTCPVAATDYDELWHLWRKTPGIGLSKSDDRAAIVRFLERNPGLSRAVRHEGQLIAAVLCGHDGRRGYLHHLVVVEEYRRRGLGRKLVGECIARLRDAGIDKCNIFLFADNADGECFWRASGFAHRADLKLLQRNTAERDHNAAHQK